MLLFIDNFDSFTHNIVQYFRMSGCRVHIARAHRLDPNECLALKPRLLVIGPGPGTPSQARLSNELLKITAGSLPTLGICLGHQAIAECYGGVVRRADRPMHGKTSSIHHTDRGIFKGIPQGFTATRYHSLIVEEASLPDCLEVTARSEIGEIMGLSHRTLPVEGVQFHPESVLTEHGLLLFKQFLKR